MNPTSKPLVFWLWKGRNPMRHIEQGEWTRFLCGRFIGSGYSLVDSSEKTPGQMKALVDDPANARYLCEGCSQAFKGACSTKPKRIRRPARQMLNYPDAWPIEWSTDARTE